MSDDEDKKQDDTNDDNEEVDIDLVEKEKMIIQRIKNLSHTVGRDK